MQITLEAARKNAGYKNRKEVAERLGVSERSVSAWEKYENTPSVKKAIEISNLYKLGINEILW